MCLKKNLDFLLLVVFVVVVTERYFVGAGNAPKLILYVQGKTIAEILLANDGQIIHCSLQELEEDADAEPIVKAKGLPVKYPSFAGMLKLIKDCSKRHLPTGKNNDTELTAFQEGSPVSTTPAPTNTWSLWRGIVPGTKWCGINDIAQNFDDLGMHYQVDSCCRAHDNCPVKLKAFRTGYDLMNFGFYTKSHCDCDSQFYGCLKECENEVADYIGNIFFNVMRIQCLKNRKVLTCAENKTEADGVETCSRWTEEIQEKKMQTNTTPLKYQ